MTTTSIPENAASARARTGFAKWLSNTKDLTSRFVAAGRIPGLINIAGGLPAPETFPVEELARLSQVAVKEFPQDCLGYGPTDGLPELRDAIAARFSTPALRLDRRNVLITAGGTVPSPRLSLNSGAIDRPNNVPDGLHVIGRSALMAARAHGLGAAAGPHVDLDA